MSSPDHPEQVPRDSSWCSEAHPLFGSAARPLGGVRRPADDPRPVRRDGTEYTAVPERTAVCTHACTSLNAHPPNSVKNLLSTGSSVACSRERDRAQRKSDCRKLDCGSCCAHPCASAALAHGCRLADSCLPCAFSISQLAPHAFIVHKGETHRPSVVADSTGASVDITARGCGSRQISPGLST